MGGPTETFERMVESKGDQRAFGAGGKTRIAAQDTVEDGLAVFHLTNLEIDQVPLGAVEDAGDEVEGNQPLGRAAFGIDGEGNAEASEQLLGGVLLGDQGLDGKIVENAGKCAVGPPDFAVGRPHLVEKLAR